jgi:hypothetical protein
MTHHLDVDDLILNYDPGSPRELAAFPDVRWFSIRNASDPQISNPNHDIRAAHREAAEIYAIYGPFTTAASVIATWAVIDAARNRSG